jgi:hypothetical protein
MTRQELTEDVIEMTVSLKCVIKLKVFHKMIALKNLLSGKIDARNHQPCHSAVSCTKLILDLNLAEGRNCPTGSRPKAGTFSFARMAGFTDKRKLFIFLTFNIQGKSILYGYLLELVRYIEDGFSIPILRPHSLMNANLIPCPNYWVHFTRVRRKAG